MAYREVDMWEILEVLRRAGRGESITQIKQATGRSRKTIRRYVRLARKLGWVLGDQEPTEELAGAVQRRLKPVREDRTPGAAEARLLPHRDRIRAWLEGGEEERGLRLAKVHQLLGRQGLHVPYTAVDPPGGWHRPHPARGIRIGASPQPASPPHGPQARAGRRSHARPPVVASTARGDRIHHRTLVPPRRLALV